MENMKLENVWRVLRNYSFELNSEISNELLCTICKKIMINACNSPCGCRYCNDCLKNYLQRTEKFCPGESEDCKNVLINFDRNVYIDQLINAKIAQLQMKCPENCSDCLIELREMENHIRVCNKQRRFSPFTNIGCTDRDLIEINMKQHLLTEIHNHSNLMVQSIENLQNEIDKLNGGINEIKLEIKQTIFQRIFSMFSEKKVIFQFFLMLLFCFALINFLINNTLIGMKFQQNNQSEIIDLHSKIERFVEKLKLLEMNYDQKHKEDHFDQTEFTWIIYKFREKLKRAESGTALQIFSDPFYSHKNGYKMSLVIYPNGYYGESEGECISLFFCIMKGGFDDQLSWPFKMNVTMILINQHTNSPFVYEILDNNTYADSPNRNKPTTFRNNFIGFSNFIELKELFDTPGLILNDQIIIRARTEM